MVSVTRKWQRFLELRNRMWASRSIGLKNFSLQNQKNIQMDFDQLKHLWDSQNKQNAMTMNTDALHTTILAKQHQAKKITHVTELLVLFVNLGSAVMLTAMNLSNSVVKVYPFLLAAWMT